jgi:hypothetical protein
MSLVLGADDAAAHGGLSVMGNKVYFTLLAAKAVCVPYAQRGEGAALLVSRIRRRGRRREPRLTNSS